MIRIRAMTMMDVPLGMRLKEESGWNQLDADWIRFLEMGADGCFVAELDGRAVGTTTTMRFGPIAWIAMVLVDSSVRQRGVGTALMEHALAFLDQRQVRSVRLDATPLGQPIYERLGFQSQYTLARYGGTPEPAALTSEVRPYRPEDLPQLVELDEAVTATDRRQLLTRLGTEYPETVRVIERARRIEGYVMARPGARAWQVGPCIARRDAGVFLIRDACHRLAAQPVFLDIPLEHPGAISLAESLGLVELRRLTRMCRGAAVCERVGELWCSSGPEKG